jgi:hypothetical protein
VEVVEGAVVVSVTVVVAGAVLVVTDRVVVVVASSCGAVQPRMTAKKTGRDRRIRIQVKYLRAL